MSPRFISAGAIDATTGETKSLPAPLATSSSTATRTGTGNKKSQEWLDVQKQLEQARAASKTAVSDNSMSQHGERSLYEVLQANKAAKQAAFEEATRLRNQFRALDDDEVEFLETVNRQKRDEEEQIRKETEEGLRVFRERQHAGGMGEGGEEGDEEEGDGDEVWWDVGGGRKKRRRNGGRDEEGKKKRVKGLLRKKIREENSIEEEVMRGEKVDEKVSAAKEEFKPSAPLKTQQGASPTAAAVGGVRKLGGLVDYGSSDEDDDD